ncbi:MAG: NUDIX domain-containing protein, partial [Deltaproteobacteria bacterium]|nr:NUDIX domain-containing protein [Deltaproteobacteria bacterium]
MGSSRGESSRGARADVPPDAPAPTPNAASAVVLRRDGRVLLVQRGRPPNEGVWTLPGGRVEPGETVAAAAAREVLEETGIEVEVVSHVGDVAIGAFVIAVHAAVPMHDDDATLDAASPGDDARAVCWASAEGLATLGVPEPTRAAIANASSRVPPAADPHASSRVP